MVNFCTKCGSTVDAATGLCPRCDRGKLDDIAAKSAPKKHNFCTLCGGLIDEQTGKCLNPDCKNGLKLKKVKAPKARLHIDMNKPAGKTRPIMLQFAFCLFITTLLAVLILDVRNTADEDNIEALLDNIAATEVIDQSGVVERDDLNDFYDWLYSKFDLNVNDSKLDRFVEKSTVKNYIADITAEFLEDLFDGDSAELTVEKSDVIRLIEKNNRVIDKVFGNSVYGEDKYKLADGIFAADENFILSSKSIEKESPVLYYGIVCAVSYVSMGLFMALSLLIIFFMFKKNVPQAMLYVGVDFSIIGGVGVLIAILAGWISGLWKGGICNGSFIGVMTGNFFAVNALSSIIILAIGVLLIVLLIVLRKLLKKSTLPTAY